MREGASSRFYILKGFQIFYLVGCFVMANFSWRQRRHLLMFCCRHVLF